MNFKVKLDFEILTGSVLLWSHINASNYFQESLPKNMSKQFRKSALL